MKRYPVALFAFSLAVVLSLASPVVWPTSLPAVAQGEAVEGAAESAVEGGAAEGAAEEAAIAESEPEAIAAPASGDYFADVIVRGQTIFQVGSLNQLSASDRAAIINRRIASLIERTSGEVSVTAEPVADQNLITIQANRRVLMTVTAQDAQDLGLPLEVLAERWSERLKQNIDQPPIVKDVAQRLNSTVSQLGQDTVASIPALIGVLIVTVVTWLIAKGVRFSAFKWAQQTEGDRGTEVLIGRLGYGAVWVAGAVVARGVWGIVFATMLCALGLTSVAIGFSLKDVLSNYISGVILLSARPFHIGDQVVINGYEGTITQVQLRTTTLKTYDGRMVYIPNQEVFQASITNNTAADYLRSSVVVGIDYDANIAEARQVIIKAVSSLEIVQATPPPEMLVSELAASTVNIEVRFWVASHRADFLETTSQVSQRVKEALQTHNIEMPTEIYTLLLKDVPEEMKQRNGGFSLNMEDGSSRRGSIEGV
ncbi:MAG: mechanosensitive ion channel family protein [Phormidesmis sp.]